MSMFYSLCMNDRIELLTDGAWYLDDGTLVDIGTKVRRSTSKPLCATGRGSTDVVKKFTLLVTTIADFSPSVDHAITEIASRLGQVWERRDEAVQNHAEILISCISESLGPTNLYWCSGNFYSHLEPWVLHNVGHEIGGGGIVSDEALALAGITPERMAKEGFAQLCAEVFELARREKGSNPMKPENPPLYGIGGFIEHTVVTAAGVTTTKIKEWPDEIGKPIDPFASIKLDAAE
ncbi:hypothetical protein [Agrobacterium pusense]|uniref:hypothetical protein n=1 Tax=Agrobacterium pusense TaxID=648995 RepID=UPI0010AE7CC8|nr:hypothetical protein [Agrobacterium pusense]WCK22958.1 hypothetical protein CFBP5496_0009350 [Agrobacterium pusense]